MMNASKQIVTHSLATNKHTRRLLNLPTSEETLPNANEGIHHRLFIFAVPSTYPYLFGVCLVYVYVALKSLMMKDTNQSITSSDGKSIR